jgi:hypothetical protein
MLLKIVAFFVLAPDHLFFLNHLYWVTYHSFGTLGSTMQSKTNLFWVVRPC